jgi:hypothetical protein
LQPLGVILLPLFGERNIFRALVSSQHFHFAFAREFTQPLP